ncbi:MAG: DEAD/DEAH box helicase [Candidatus Diapherotrites archaeon]|nr:DEAD/DEAH box helicase [Candidatus Diapherotrites archaeon]
MDVSKSVLIANNFPKYNPMQEKCLDKLTNSLVVSAPTASGKTIIAELFILEQVINEGKKVIYTCPLRALASEHYKDFKRKYPDITFALSTGDMDSSSSYLKKFDVIFTTYEKLASLLRHKTEWLQRVGCIIVDEIHELDSDRGPVLEIALTQMRNMHKNLNVLGLSATIPNAKELSEWLNAELVKSDFRPVSLKEGVLFESDIEYKDKSTEKGDFEDTVEKNLDEEKQMLVFANSRKRAEGLAKKLSPKTKNIDKEKNQLKLEKISNSVLNALEQPTEQCASLADCIRGGIAFHHAGLVPKQRELVEENFRNGLIKIICATPTLAAGVNTPADVVLIPSLYRYGNFGMELINVREYKQMSGRSGRPKFSTEGKSIVVANNETQKELYLEKYINGDLEGIESKLSNATTLRTHTLALIATGDIYNDKSIWKFFEKTLFAKQTEDIGEIYESVSEIVDELKEFGFVCEKGEYFVCTPLGKRVSDLFLDPKSAFSLINALKDKRDFKDFSYLYAWVNCHEFFPLLNYSKKLESILWEEYNARMNEIPFSKENLLFDNTAVQKFFSALMMENWISEKREQTLFKDFGLAPGLLFSKTRLIEWLAYSTIELSKVLGEDRHLVHAKKLSLRVKYGVKEELLALVELKGIGRARARKLFSAGITKPSEIRKNVAKVEQLLGKKISENLKRQLKISE